MWQVIVYATVVAAALSLMGFCDEKLSNMLDRPRRYFWVSTMVMSLAWPVAMMLWLQPAAGLVPAPAVIETPAAVRGLLVGTGPDAVSIDTRPREGLATKSTIPSAGLPAASVSSIAAQATAAKRWKAPSDRTVLLTWAAVSSLLLLGLAIADLLLQRRASRWQRARVLGHEVLVSESTGPALLGVWRPRIVVPRWFLDEPAEAQSLILDHERQHIAARDPLLLRLALCVVVAVPWNLPLWWQLRRLRLCIELDCDARVLRGGAQAAVYGEVLLAVTQRAGNVPIGVVAMGEPTSALERRIRHLTPDPGRHSVLWASIALLFWGASIGLAAMPRVPAIPLDRADSTPVPAGVRAASPPAIPVAPASMVPTTATPDVPASSQTMAAAQAQQPDGGAARADPSALPRLPLPIAVSAEVARVLHSLAPEITTMDASRSRQSTGAAVLAAHPEWLSPADGNTLNRVTAFLTADGKVDRFYMESFASSDQNPYFDDVAPGGIVPELLARNWERLGLRPQQLGQMGLLYVKDGTAESGRDLLLLYAWPRRPGEPLGGAVPNDGAALRVSFTHADVAAALQRHLPDALSEKGATPAGVPWLLLSQQGAVMKSGYVPAPVPPGSPARLIESANPGMRVVYGMQVAGRAGQHWAERVILAWLPPAR